MNFLSFLFKYFYRVFSFWQKKLLSYQKSNITDDENNIGLTRIHDIIADSSNKINRPTLRTPDSQGNVVLQSFQNKVGFTLSLFLVFSSS